MNFQRSYPYQFFAPLCVVLFFVLKASLTGIWIVRPWDVPDEIGHFSYIRDLTSGKGLPVLHESLLDAEAWDSFAPEAGPTPGNNWIAQHPPLYHAMMVPVYGVGTLFGDSMWVPFYLIRLCTALLFGAGIWVLMAVLRETGLGDRVSIGLGIMVSCIPNHTFLAAAVNHDALVFLLGCLVLLFWVRFTKSGSSLDLIWLGLCLGLGGISKYTFLVLFPPVIGLVLVQWFLIHRTSLSTIFIFHILALVPIGFWVIRNLITYGELFPVDMSGFISDEPLGVSFLEFGRMFPVFSILTQTFWGLLGWMGDANLQVRWLQIYSIYQQAYTWPLLLLLVVSLFYLAKHAIGRKEELIPGIAGSLLFFGLLVSSGWLHEEFNQFLPFLILSSLVSGWIFFVVIAKICARKVDTQAIVTACSLFCFFFFLGVFLLRIYSFSNSAGTLQGTFGRYFLPVLGFLIIGLFSTGLQRFRYSPQLVMVAACIYCCVEVYVWLHEAIPFFYVYE